ncbi:hypothetical protein [Roseivirga sp. 4D4]|uniref:hypothetical protein n=1 Tax=Roseivirga sp. 4D4 TaxID=1889784 RepID=UPI001112E07A|nr:hypothetical protein [Roseivirga sp. 4D4]
MLIYNSVSPLQAQSTGSIDRENKLIEYIFNRIEGGQIRLNTRQSDFFWLEEPIIVNELKSKTFSCIGLERTLDAIDFQLSDESVTRLKSLQPKDLKSGKWPKKLVRELKKGLNKNDYIRNISLGYPIFLESHSKALVFVHGSSGASVNIYLWEPSSGWKYHCELSLWVS